MSISVDTQALASPRRAGLSLILRYCYCNQDVGCIGPSHLLEKWGLDVLLTMYLASPKQQHLFPVMKQEIKANSPTLEDVLKFDLRCRHGSREKNVK